MSNAMRQSLLVACVYDEVELVNIAWFKVMGRTVLVRTRESLGDRRNLLLYRRHRRHRRHHNQLPLQSWPINQR